MVDDFYVGFLEMVGVQFWTGCETVCRVCHGDVEEVYVFGFVELVRLYVEILSVSGDGPVFGVAPLYHT